MLGRNHLHLPSNRETVMPILLRRLLASVPLFVESFPLFAVNPTGFLSVTVARLRRIYTGLPFRKRTFL